MAGNTYIFKKFEIKSYSDYSRNLVPVSYQPLVYFADLEDKYNFLHIISQIPEETLELLKELLQYYNLNDFKEALTI